MEIGLSYFSKINDLCPQRPKSRFLPFSDPEVHDHNMECIERNIDGTDYGLNPGPQNSLYSLVLYQVPTDLPRACDQNCLPILTF